MKALVTGVAGFVGHTLARSLLAEGHEVVGVDCLTDYYETAIKERNLATVPRDRFTFHRADLNRVDLHALLDGVDWVFHQAGQPGVRMSWGQDFAVYHPDDWARLRHVLGERVTQEPPFAVVLM